jgi:hypothetical protein
LISLKNILSIGLVYLRPSQPIKGFTSGEFEEYANSLGIKLLNSSPHYPQENGQVEAATKGIIKLIKHKIDENSKWWHTILNEALWAYRMACHGATKVSPYQLVYDHDDVLPWELKTGSRRTSLQDQLSADVYSATMKEELDDRAANRLRALDVRQGYPSVPTNEAHGRPRQVGPTYQKTRQPDSGPN